MQTAVHEPEGPCSSFLPDTGGEPGLVATWSPPPGPWSAVSPLRTGRQGPPLAPLRGLHPAVSPLPEEPALCNLSPGWPAWAASPAPAPIGFPFLDRPRSPGDEFPHYLRDLHIGHVPCGPECPRSVWGVAPGSPGGDQPGAWGLFGFCPFSRRARIGQDFWTVAVGSR